MSAPIPRFKPYYLTPQDDGEYVRYSDYAALNAQVRALTQPINNEELRAHFWESEFTNVYHTSVEHVDAIFTERRISALAATDKEQAMSHDGLIHPAKDCAEQIAVLQSEKEKIAIQATGRIVELTAQVQRLRNALGAINEIANNTNGHPPPIPEDLQELYSACLGVEGSGLWIPNAADRVKELIERIAASEARIKALESANQIMRVRYAARRAALAATEKTE